MNLGLSIASHSGLPPARIGELAGAAERAGFAAVFVAEGHGDALALCHPVAAATRRVRVGTAVTNAALRPPVLAAKTAAQLDHAAEGRFILGLGVGNAVMNARFGLSPVEPLRMVEEYVGVVRSVLGGGTGYDGQLFRTGTIPLDSRPARADLPIWLGALGPRMLALAGRIADGVILNLTTPAQAGQAAGAVRDAARAAGRDPASVEVACVVHCCLSDDPAAAAAAARAVVPRYVLHPAVAQLFEADLGNVRELTLAGDRAGAACLVPQRVADGFVAWGDAGRVAARLAEYRAARIDLPVIFPMPVGGEWGYEQTIAAFSLGGTAISQETELVVRFFAAIEAGDLGALREIYAPDALIWHNDDLLEQSVEDNLKVLQGLHRAVSGLHYDIIRRAATADGVLQQHVLRGRLPNGAEVELHAAMYLQVRGGRITRIEEYLDSARRSEIRKAREALSAG